MKSFLRLLLVAFGLFCAPLAAHATTCGGNCYWILDSGTWDNATDSAHWSATDGGVSCTPCEPASTDTVNFTTNSCLVAGTCTITTAAGTLTNASLTLGTCGTSTHVCSFNFSTNNTSFAFGTVSWGQTGGTGYRTIITGTGTWTISGTAGTVWNNATITNETLTITGAPTLNFAATATGSRTAAFGNKPYGSTVVNVSDSASFASQTWVFATAGGGTFTIGQFNLTGPIAYQVPATSGLTTSGTSTWTGTSSAPVFVQSNGFSTTSAVVLNGNVNATWTAVRNIVFSGTGTLTANSSIDLGGNTLNGGSITPPSTGGGGRIIGG